MSGKKYSRATHILSNGTSMTTIFASFVWHRNYPGPMHIINLLLHLPYTAQRHRGRHIKTPGTLT